MKFFPRYNRSKNKNLNNAWNNASELSNEIGFIVPFWLMVGRYSENLEINRDQYNSICFYMNSNY